MYNPDLVVMRTRMGQCQKSLTSGAVRKRPSRRYFETNHKVYLFSEEICQNIPFSDKRPNKVNIAQLTGNSVDALEKSFLDKYFEQSKLNGTSITKEEFQRVVEAQAEVMFMEAELERLGEAPERKFVPYKDNIIEFLLADDGWAPWNKAGLLSKPRLKEHDPKAYRALFNFKGPLPKGLKLYTQRELTDRLVAPLLQSQVLAARAAYQRE
jgi:hypothetical protein